MDITLRPVKPEDCDLLFGWANDGTVRQNAFNSRPIPYEEHKVWFEHKLNSDKSLIYIGYMGEEAVGQIRIDIEGDTGLIDYSIAKEHRGRGYGTLFLERIVCVMEAGGMKVKKLAGRVKPGNIASQKAFEKAGYSSSKNTEYVEYLRVLS